MKTDIPLLQNVRIASPCTASWDAMKPVNGDRVRFCDGCRKRVYNLSALGQAEAEGLLRANEGHLCVRYYRRTDGTILTNDCPVGLAAARQLVMTRAKASVGLCFLLCIALAAHNATQRLGKPMTGDSVPGTGLSAPLMGSLAMPPPAHTTMGKPIWFPDPPLKDERLGLLGQVSIGTVAPALPAGSSAGPDQDERATVVRTMREAEAGKRNHGETR